MSIWLGNSFAEQSATILQVLAIGVFMNAIAWLPFTLIQSLGRPDVTAKIHLIELPFYLIMLFLFIKSYGALGASVAWTVRTSIDSLLMFYFSKYLQRDLQIEAAK